LQFLGGKTLGFKQLACQRDPDAELLEFAGSGSVTIPTVERWRVIVVLTVIKLRTIVGRKRILRARSTAREHTCLLFSLH
jgi:hypothetical protein